VGHVGALAAAPDEFKERLPAVGFTDKYSWIPGFFAGFGAALPFDATYQPKAAVGAIVNALQTVRRC